MLDNILIHCLKLALVSYHSFKPPLFMISSFYHPTKPKTQNLKYSFKELKLEKKSLARVSKHELHIINVHRNCDGYPVIFSSDHSNTLV